MEENKSVTSKKRGRPATKKQGEIKVEGEQESASIVKNCDDRPLVDKNQLTVIKQALGWNEGNPLRYPDKAPRNAEVKPTLYSYRNRFFTDKCASLDDLVEKGLMEYTDCGLNGMTRKGYKVTEAGIKYLEDTEKITIKIKPPRNGENWRSIKPKR